MKSIIRLPGLVAFYFWIIGSKLLLKKALPKQ